MPRVTHAQQCRLNIGTAPLILSGGFQLGGIYRNRLVDATSVTLLLYIELLVNNLSLDTRRLSSRGA